jgi:hypothetical protein
LIGALAWIWIIGFVAGVFGTIFDQRKDFGASGIVLHLFLIIAVLLLVFT